MPYDVGSILIYRQGELRGCAAFSLHSQHVQMARNHLDINLVLMLCMISLGPTFTDGSPIQSTEDIVVSGFCNIFLPKIE